ncbi:MAG TPA: hypothetical protein VMX18_00975 [Candidatus Bipolaricaulota bacterium]|nr:hypothetical protein [Candidatus Bipolaricaulota bacterium]
MKKNKKAFLYKPILISALAILGIALIVAATPKHRAQIAGSCSVEPVSSSTFIKTYHLRDLTDGYNVLQVKDGGYLISGDTMWSSGMSVGNPFLVKVDAKGNPSWSKQFSSQSLPPRDSSTRHEPHVSAETSDGGIVYASDILDFVDAKYEKVLEVYGDILVTKVNSKGVQSWSTMLGDYSVDRPQKIWALPDGGVMLLARFAQTGYGNDVADISAVPKYSVLIKIDKDGKALYAKKMDWEAVDMERLTDGGFVALANISVPTNEQPDNILGPEVVLGDLPTIVKLNDNLDIEWAKSLEMIPSEIVAPISYSSADITLGKTSIRMMGGDFKAVQPTSDGGFLAVGFENLLSTQGLSNGIDSITSFTPRSFIVAKVDASGNYKWAKNLTVGLVSGATAIDFQMAKTVDGYFVIMQDVIRDSEGVEAKYSDAGKKQKVLWDKCEELNSDCLDPDSVPELKELWDASKAASQAFADALASNIELIKIDGNANPIWIKRFDAERNLSGYDIASTTDKGVVVSASMLTDKTHLVMLSQEPYKEAALIKVDVNGGASGYADVTDYREATLEDQSEYLVMQDMEVGMVSDMTLNVNTKVKENVPSISNASREICKYQLNKVEPTCDFLTDTTSKDPGTTPVAKTWALINYDNTKEVAVEGDKNQTVHDELLPILNEVFDDQVKLKDNMKSMWLTYVFSRLVTRADVIMVQEKYQALGYKVEESEGGSLWLTRVGLTLHMTFSIINYMVGKVEVFF